MLGGALVHVVGCVGLPYLSQDPLFYAAIGRSLTVYGAEPTDLLSRVMPADDPFLLALPSTWRGGNSPYGPAFHLLARAVASIGGDDLVLQLRLYQLAGLLTMLGVALIVGAAARGLQGLAPARAAAMVLFCPIAIVEGTQSAHNDGLLALATAGFVWAMARRRPALGAASLLAGVVVKLSALLWFGVHLGQLGFDAFRRLGARRRAIVATTAVVAVAAVCYWQRAWLAGALTALIDNPKDRLPHCTRSLECLPRAALKWFSEAPLASWAVGILFRVLAGIWLVVMAIRSAAPARRLDGLATAMFIYYLCLHPWSQSWYLLPLLPLLPFVEPTRRTPMLVFCVTATLYYTVAIPFGCVTGELYVASVEVAESFITIIPPIWLLIRRIGAPA
jgi:hypothetical protein